MLASRLVEAPSPPRVGASFLDPISHGTPCDPINATAVPCWLLLLLTCCRRASSMLISGCTSCLTFASACPLSPIPCSHAVLRNEESMRSRCPNASSGSEMSCRGKWQSQDCIYSRGLVMVRVPRYYLVSTSPAVSTMSHSVPSGSRAVVMSPQIYAE